jgi:hypothetical protein
MDRYPDVGMVYTGFNWVDELGRIKKVFRNRPVSDLPLENVVGPCFLYRKSIAEVVGSYHPERCFVEDWDYWLRIVSTTQIQEMDGVHYDLTARHSNVTDRQSPHILEASYWMRLNTPCERAREPEEMKRISRRLATVDWAKKRFLTACLWRLRSRGWNV